MISDDEALELAATYDKYYRMLEEAVAGAVKAGCNLELSDHFKPFVFEVRRDLMYIYWWFLWLLSI